MEAVATPSKAPFKCKKPCSLPGLEADAFHSLGLLSVQKLLQAQPHPDAGCGSGFGGGGGLESQSPILASSATTSPDPHRLLTLSDPLPPPPWTLTSYFNICLSSCLRFDKRGCKNESVCREGVWSGDGGERPKGRLRVMPLSPPPP